MEGADRAYAEWVRRGVSVVPSAEVLDGRYELGPVLGRGGMGEVRRAHDRRLARDVAIKFLRADYASHPEVRARFASEARNAARLTHPNVVLVLDSGEADGVPYLVMECLPGRSLHDVIAEGPVPQEQAWLWADEILGALGAAHVLGVIHRDVTPSNILITEDGHAKIADFGIAKTADSFSHTAVGQVMGTPAYLAPERVSGDEATAASDVYSLGVVFYEALTGTNPFKAGTPIATAHSVVATHAPPLHDVRPDVDPAFAAAIDHAMAKSPEQRTATAEAMRAELATTLDEADATVPLTVALPTLGAAVPTWQDRVRATPRQVWVTIVVVAAVGLLLLAVTDQSGDGEDVVATDPTSATTPTTLAPTTQPTVAEVPVVAPSPGNGEGKKRGKKD